jgi:outer membrane cobalamin receptor
LLAAAVAATLAVSAGCGHNVRPRVYQPPGEQLILREDIAQSGAQDAWDVVRRLTHMSTSTTVAGEPARMYRRGRGSLVIRETPLVIIDGARSNDIQALARIRADQIAWMRILTGAASTTLFGADGGAGAVIVQTAASDQSVASNPSH